MEQENKTKIALYAAKQDFFVYKETELRERTRIQILQDLVEEAFGKKCKPSFFGPKSLGIIVRKKNLQEREREKYCDMLYRAFLPGGIAFFDEDGLDITDENLEEMVRRIAKQCKCYLVVVLE